QTATLGDAASFTMGDFTHDDSIEAMASSVLIEAPETFALAGLSMGGYVALEIMRQAPERVARLALIDTQARPDTDEATARRHALLRIAEGGRFDTVADRLMPLLLDAPRIDDPILTALVRSMAHAVGAEAFARQQRAIIGRADSRPGLSAIACPTLVLCGAHDLLTPVDRHEEMAQAIRGAAFVVIPACGHMAPIERPREVARAFQAWLGD
ncbi:MAG: alpha/beta fold hydrolase, partial [Proteobacteria bacterium]|nr:alpha/beta fold hydrolase [Pseudomonadota bacterium]